MVASAIYLPSLGNQRAIAGLYVLRVSWIALVVSFLNYLSLLFPLRYYIMYF